MALHGTINVNATPIIQWSAVRQQQHPDVNRYDPQTGSFIYTYDCEVLRFADGKRVNFELRHAYSDGAAALAAAVIDTGEYYLKKLEATHGDNR